MLQSEPHKIVLMLEEENELSDFELDRILTAEAILKSVEDLFSERIEIEDFPIDYYIEKTVDGKKVRRLNEKKYLKGVDRTGSKLFITKRIDRRNKDDLKRVITTDLEHFTSIHPDNKSHIFKTNLLERLEEYQTSLCPNWELVDYVEERELYYDFEAYKEALLELIPGESLMNEKTNELELPEIVLKSQKEKIRLLYDLGVIDFLQEKWPNALKNPNRVAQLIADMYGFQRRSIASSVRLLLKEEQGDHYPAPTKRTKAIIAQLNASEPD
jgi:hypothetical protein